MDVAFFFVHILPFPLVHSSQLLPWRRTWYSPFSPFWDNKVRQRSFPIWFAIYKILFDTSVIHLCRGFMGTLLVTQVATLLYLEVGFSYFLQSDVLGKWLTEESAGTELGFCRAVTFRTNWWDAWYKLLLELSTWWTFWRCRFVFFNIQYESFVLKKPAFILYCSCG